MEPLIAVSAIARTIQLSVAPVFLLAGIGAILNLLAGRLARVVDRARVLEEWHGKSVGDEHERHVRELRLLDLRMSVVNASLFLITASAIAICLVVALLFIAELIHLKIGNTVAISFIIAMLLLVAGLIMFLVEVSLARKSIHIRDELLERDRYR